jgi:hypothetical protein
MDMSDEIKNAKIESVKLTNEDHGLLSAWLYLDYGGSGQGFGGHCLYLPKIFSHSKQSMQANYAGHFIWRCLEIAEVGEWSKLKGKTIRVKSSHASVEAIGHITKDDWFCPREDFQKMQDMLPKVKP